MNSINTSRSLNRRGFVGAAAGIGAAGLLGGALGRPATASAAASESRTRVETIKLGKVTVTRVLEYSGPVGMTSRQFFPGSPKELWEENKDWLSPDFWKPGTDMVNSALQTWVLRSGGRTILIDTGAGNDKFRPYAKQWQYMDTGFLGRLSRAGVRPEDVDVVVNTHLHNDHVGWNTRREGRDWVPTFPNATYLIPKIEFDFWNPAGPVRPKYWQGNQNVWEDSVLPVHEAGLVKLWEGSYILDSGLKLDLAAGHTPGSSVIRLESGNDRAVFIGDLLHTPLQLEHPEFNSCFEEDEKQALATRRRELEWAADHKALILPAHLPGHGAAEVERSGGNFRIKEWAGFSRS
ncbi:MBL fold metallo-hydrolase [Nonomuraea glycinis]|uniref:MBL fold metallo-hydrolase n=1 Tax=Nonomuraea glycinis TaxID=2047744 RepID=A0A918A1S4_9ACTN|nr:MBL fold metallo-hydrolase [Nonomuraea glycinis]MCA2182129.1 MBL fold metallo-hydrolase [Nonomuraea glycinis]GGP02237.1 MBL fold metallo-hydrolase [Nonomuraea glycinis]